MPASVPEDFNLVDPALYKGFQDSCTVSVLEVGYTSDSSLASSVARKHEQHLQLCQLLVQAGWRLDGAPASPFRVLLLGSTGHVFTPALATLMHFGVARPEAVALLRRLFVHAASFAHSLVSRRRRLELLVHPHKPP